MDYGQLSNAELRREVGKALGWTISPTPNREGYVNWFDSSGNLCLTESVDGTHREYSYDKKSDEFVGEKPGFWTTLIAPAMELLEESYRNWSVRSGEVILNSHLDVKDWVPSVEFRCTISYGGEWYEAAAASLPHAICIAWLRMKAAQPADAARKGGGV